MVKPDLVVLVYHTKHIHNEQSIHVFPLNTKHAGMPTGSQKAGVGGAGYSRGGVKYTPGTV